MHRSMSVSAQGSAKGNLHWVNSGDLPTRIITEGKHHELIHAHSNQVFSGGILYLL